MPKTISPRIKTFLTQIKTKNHSLSCRQAAKMTERRFLVKVSKSRINLLWKNKELSQHVGRPPGKKALIKTQLKNAGFAFILIADSQLQVSRILAENVKQFFPDKSPDYLQKAFQELMCQKLYSTEELWTIKEYNFSNSKLLSIIRRVDEHTEDFTSVLRQLAVAQEEVVSVKLLCQNTSEFNLDAQMRSICLNSTPETFSMPLCQVKEEIEAIFLHSAPLILFAIPGFSLYGQDITDLLFSIQGTDDSQVIKQAVLLGAQGNEKARFSELSGKSYNIIFGLWPQQYQLPEYIMPKAGWRSIWFEPLKYEFFIGESKMSITQHIAGQEIMLRLVHIKEKNTGRLLLTIGTNMSKAKLKAKDIALLYLNRWPYVFDGYQDYLQLKRQKMSFFSAISDSKIQDCQSLLQYSLTILKAYVQNHFFAGKEFLCQDRLGSLPARIKYRKKMILLEFLPPEGFGYKEELKFACRRANETKSSCKRFHNSIFLS